MSKKLHSHLKPWIYWKGYVKKCISHNLSFFWQKNLNYVFLTNIKILAKIFPKCVYFTTEGEFIDYIHGITGENIDVFYFFKPFVITVKNKKYKNKYPFAICDAITDLRYKWH